MNGFKTWLQQRWPYVLAAMAAAVLVLFFVARRRATSAASQISFPAPTSGGGAGAALDSGLSGAAAAAQDFGKFVLRARLPDDAGGVEGNPGVPVFLRPSTEEGAAADFIDFGKTIPASGEPVLGTLHCRGGQCSALWLPFQWGGRTLYAWWLDVAPITGQGGGPRSSFPRGIGGSALLRGRASRTLAATALSAETQSHVSAVTDPRRARRLARLARQASGESRRIFAESRGPAPLGGPTRLIGRRYH